MLQLYMTDVLLLCRHFNMVVIDEATQATEPATLVPLTQVHTWTLPQHALRFG